MARALRVIIAGGPRSGKTTLARSFGVPFKSTDDVKHLPWSEVSAVVAPWFDRKGSWVVEGVRTVHAIRRWLQEHHEGTPADLVIFLDGARLNLTPAQANMKKGILTVWAEIQEELERRGTVVEVRSTADTAETRKQEIFK